MSADLPEFAGGLRRDVVTLPRSGRRLTIDRPAELDPLIDAVEHDPEQNLPYWAELWPSGIALGDAIALEPQQLAGTRVIELGCGLGVTACAALAAGAGLTVCDYAPEALALCRHNARLNGSHEPDRAIRLNWRRPDEDFFEVSGAPFPVVLAADVLYESRDVQPLLHLLERLLEPNGILWLAEPRRPVAARFIERALEAGWRREGQVDHWADLWPDPSDEGTVVNVHLLRRAEN